jgi:serine/threonine-protein kinase
LAQVHPALAPMRPAGAGYALDLPFGSAWFALTPGRGFAGYGLSRALRMLLDVLAGLTVLHETEDPSDAPFVHGEVVPALIRVDAQGIARLQPLAPWHWQTSETPFSAEATGHLAPERLLGDAMDGRADVYSAGVLLWEALAGKRLFEDISADEIITRLMGGKVKLPELPPELAWAIPLKPIAMRALSVDPEQRFTDCPELAAAIEAVARGRIASHAMVATRFAAPARAPTSFPPVAPVPSLDEGFRASHKSSLSALVAPAVAVTPAAFEVQVVPGQSVAVGRPRRGLWMATALVSLAAALGVAAFTQRNRTYTPAHVALPSAASQPVVAAVAPLVTAPAVSAEPSALAPGSEPSTPVPSASASPDEGARLAPEKAARSTRTTPEVPAGKAHATPKPSKLGAPAKPARIRDKEAEQYGI